MLALLRLAIDIRPAELASTLLSAAYFFCVLCSYFVLRPLREALGLAGGVGELTWLFMGTLIAMLAVNPLFAALVTRFRREVFIPVTYAFFVVNLLAFAALLQFAPERVNLGIGRVFYVWLSVFNLFAVSVFWAFMSDLWVLEQSKRLYGFIGVGGTLGALVGAALTQQFVRQIGAPALLLLAAALLVAALACVLLLARRADGIHARPRRREPAGDVWNGIRLVFRSSYLRGICAYMLLLAVASTFLYFAQARIVAAAVIDRSARTAIFARIDFWTQVLTLATQVFATGRLVRWLGVGATLAALPVFTAAGVASLLLMPTLGVLIVVQVLNRASRYAVSSPARETLFTVVTREEKYKSKNLIDTFVYRLGDVAGALTDKAIASLGFGLVGLTYVSLPLAAAWVALSFYLSRTQGRLAGQHADSAPASELVGSGVY